MLKSQSLHWLERVNNEIDFHQVQVFDCAL